MALTPQVLVGETTPTEDITELIEDLSWSSTSPGGFASCSFTIPGAGLLKRVNLLREGNVLHVRDGAVSLWEGVVVNHPHPGTFGDNDTCTVEGGGLLSVAKNRADYCKVWTDDDLTQWVARPGNNSSIYLDADAGLRIGIDIDDSARTDQGAQWWYWIDSGMGDDDIDHIVFSASWEIGSSYDAFVQTSTHPWGGFADSHWVASADTSPASAQRDPTSGSYPAGTRCVRFRFAADITNTATGDRYLLVSAAEVFRSTAQKTIDEAMCEVADDTGLAASTTSAAVGTAVALAVRPFTTRAGALEELAALHSAPVDYGFWDDKNFDVRPRAAAPAIIDHLIVHASDPGMTWDVTKRAEGAPEYVAVTHAEVSGATYPQGTTKLTYSPSTPATDADVHVALLDYSDTALTTAWAVEIGAQYLDWAALNVYEGTVTVKDRVTRVDGIEVPASHIRAGQWVECPDIVGHEPLYIAQCEYDAGSQTATLSIGTLDEFKFNSSGGFPGKYYPGYFPPRSF